MTQIFLFLLLHIASPTVSDKILRGEVRVSGLLGGHASRYINIPSATKMCVEGTILTSFLGVYTHKFIHSHQLIN